MIRFVYVGDQVNEGAREFAFFDTVTESWWCHEDNPGDSLFDAEDLMRLPARQMNLAIDALRAEPSRPPHIRLLVHGTDARVEVDQGHIVIDLDGLRYRCALRDWTVQELP